MSKRRVMRKARLEEISLVDYPAQTGARVVMRKRDFSDDERKKLADSGAAMPDGSFPISNSADLHNAMQAIGRAKDPAAAKAHIRARAKALGLSDLLSDAFKNLPQGDADLLNKGRDSANTPAADGGKDTSMTPEQVTALEKSVKDQKEQLEAVTKRADRAEKVSELSDAQKVLFRKMDAKAQDEYLALSPADREIQVLKAAEDAADKDPVIFKDSEGREFRKSAGEALIAMAKSLDEERKLRQAAEKVTKGEKLAKRAAELLGKVAGDSDTKLALMEALESVPAAQRDKIDTMLKAANGVASLALEPRGVNGEPVDPNSPDAVLESLAKSIQAKDPTLTPQRAMVKALETPEGKAAYAKRLGM